MVQMRHSSWSICMRVNLNGYCYLFDDTKGEHEGGTAI